MPEPEPLPYYPQLKSAIKTVVGCLLLTYLETRYPAQQDSIQRQSSLPVAIDLDEISHVLNVHRRTLGHRLSELSCWYGTESERWSAARSAREFTAARPGAYTGRIRFYSLVGSRTHRQPVTLTLRRNSSFIAQTLASCGLSCLQATVATLPAPPIDSVQNLAARDPFCAPSTLLDVLLRGSQLGLDRRTIRYPRLRAAVAANLLDKSVLQAKQPKRKKGKVEVNEAVDPALSQVLQDIIKDQGSR